MPDKPVAPRPLTPRFVRVLALDGPWFGRPRPNAKELEGIRYVLAEGALAAKRLNLARAMAIAADNAPTAETAALIAKILKDPGADLALRRQAAALLGDIPVRASGKALVEALPGSSPMFEATLLAALAKVGEADAAQAVAARPKAASKRLARLRDFARALILYRSGGPVDERADNALLPIGQEVAITHPTVAEVSAVIERLRGSTFGLRLNPALGYAFDCGGARHLVLLSSDLQPGKLLAALLEKRRIAGMVVMQDERGSTTYLARRLIVTRPERGGIAVSVVSPTGEVELRGMLLPQDKGYALSLRNHAVRRPTEVDGFVGEDGLVLRVRVFADATSPKQSGDVDPAA